MALIIIYTLWRIVDGFGPYPQAHVSPHSLFSRVLEIVRATVGTVSSMTVYSNLKRACQGEDGQTNLYLHLKGAIGVARRVGVDSESGSNSNRPSLMTPFLTGAIRDRLWVRVDRNSVTGFIERTDVVGARSPQSCPREVRIVVPLVVHPLGDSEKDVIVVVLDVTPGPPLEDLASHFIGPYYFPTPSSSEWS